VTPEEADALRRWIQAAGWLKTMWPANAIADRISRLLSPLPTESELKELGDFLIEVVETTNFIDCNETTDLFDEPVPQIVFKDRTFCLTGVFYYGTRSDCERAIKQRRGQLRRDVAMSTDYLVVGGVCNPQWKHAEHGTKIDAAKMNRQKAQEWQPDKAPKIIRERDWVAALNTHVVAAMHAGRGQSSSALNSKTTTVGRSVFGPDVESLE
jgi:hypothetical protein